MKLKFKDGTVIEVSETENKSKEEIIAEAKEVYKDFRDSQKVEVKDSEVLSIKQMYNDDNCAGWIFYSGDENKCWGGKSNDMGTAESLPSNDEEDFTDTMVLEKKIDLPNGMYICVGKFTDGLTIDDIPEQEVKSMNEIIEEIKKGWKIEDSQNCANGECVEDAQIKDVDPETINKLIKEEEDAVRSYENTIKIAREANDETAIARYQHIIEEEMEHIQELKDLLANDVHDSNEVEDSQVQDEPAHITFNELNEIFDKHNEENGIKHQFEDPNPLYGVMVFSNENAKNGQWKQEYPLESRSYRFSSANKYFIPGMLGNSIFAECLDESERINLVNYMYDWDIEYCYIENM